MTERKSRAYHISQEAIAVCNGMDLDPSEAILFLEAEVQRREVFVDVKAAVREVMKVEGVNLAKEQKEFFRDLFAGLLKAIQEMKAK